MKCLFCKIYFVATSLLVRTQIGSTWFNLMLFSCDKALLFEHLATILFWAAFEDGQSACPTDHAACICQQRRKGTQCLTYCHEAPPREFELLED